MIIWSFNRAKRVSTIDDTRVPENDMELLSSQKADNVVLLVVHTDRQLNVLN